MSGFVYAIRCGDFVKIGWSKNPAQRISKMRTDAPHPCELLAMTAGSKEVEAAYHRQFAVHRHNREWFRFSDEIRAVIASWTAVAPSGKRQRAALGKASFVKLAEHLEETGMTLGEFAQSVGLSHASISRILNRRQTPSGRSLIRIIKASNGALTPNDFYPSIFAASEAA